MRILVGLGNPGKEYVYTRHNVGYMCVESIAGEEFQTETFKLQDNILVKPQTFMNNSGEAVKKVVEYYKVSPEDVYVIHDDLDLKLGEYKIQKGIGPKLHNGLTSIEENLKSKDFFRVRIGVDNRSPENRVPGEEYVLQNFNNEELDVLMGVMKEVRESLGVEKSV